jgi:hypothetical protein
MASANVVSRFACREDIMIRYASILTIPLLAVAVNFAQSRTAWGDEGHKVVALVAQSFLDADVRKRVAALLGADRI